MLPQYNKKASRLVLYDIDWNPANDLQAMARIWRDGQRRRVHIYRLLATGTIDEKIFQRQIAKQGLGVAIDAKQGAGAGAGAGAGKASQMGKSEFSKEDLKDLFKMHPDTASDTHDLLDCPCSGCKDGETAAQAAASSRGTESAAQRGGGKRVQKAKNVGALMSWGHLSCGEGLRDGLLQAVAPASAISVTRHLGT